MEDIDSIWMISFIVTTTEMLSEAEELIRTLCDAVVKTSHKLMQFQILSVEFDVDDSCYDPLLEPPTMRNLQRITSVKFGKGMMKMI